MNWDIFHRVIILVTDDRPAVPTQEEELFVTTFRCFLASLQEGVSLGWSVGLLIHPSVRPSVRNAFVKSQLAGKQGSDEVRQ